MYAIVNYWEGAPETATVLPDLRAHQIGWSEPFCFACGWLAPVADSRQSWEKAATGWLERAHLVDHWSGGSGDPSNLVPLCHLCHEAMSNTFSDRATALEWVNARESEMPYPAMWQMFTDKHGRAPGAVTRSMRARTLRLRGDYLMALRAAGE
jgi:hypothetical protein